MSAGLQPGAKLGEYEIEAELGAGGMGRVYRARHLTLERIVAIKTLAPQFADNELLVQRFLKEARAAARLNHPNIVQIYDFGKANGTLYLAMEYVAGESLASFLKREQFNEQEAVTIARYACRALAVAHNEGLVHRDIKPDNLMLTSRGEVKLVDLGVAKRVDEDQSLTQTGQALGTPSYISPEQIKASKEIDGRADIYSLGATLYHLVTGQPPFRGSSNAIVMSMHLYQPAPDVRAVRPELSEGLSNVIRKMMAKEPGERYANAEEADLDLYRIEIGQMPEAVVPLDEAASTALSNPTPPPQTPQPAQQKSQAQLTQPKASTTAGAAKNTNTPALTTDPNLRTLEQELAKHVGPLAKVLVKRAARTATSLQQLIVELEKEIEGDKQRRAFRSAVEKLR